MAIKNRSHAIAGLTMAFYFTVNAVHAEETKETTAPSNGSNIIDAGTATSFIGTYSEKSGYKDFGKSLGVVSSALEGVGHGEVIRQEGFDAYPIEYGFDRAKIFTSATVAGKVFVKTRSPHLAASAGVLTAALLDEASSTTKNVLGIKKAAKFHDNSSTLDASLTHTNADEELAKIRIGPVNALERASPFANIKHPSLSDPVNDNSKNVGGTFGEPFTNNAPSGLLDPPKRNFEKTEVSSQCWEKFPEIGLMSPSERFDFCQQPQVQNLIAPCGGIANSESNQAIANDVIAEMMKNNSGSAQALAAIQSITPSLQGVTIDCVDQNPAQKAPNEATGQIESHVLQESVLSKETEKVQSPGRISDVEPSSPQPTRRQRRVKGEKYECLAPRTFNVIRDPQCEEGGALRKKVDPYSGIPQFP